MMPSYRYRAVHRSGRVTKGIALARSKSELAHYLEITQLELIEARERKDRTHKARISFVWRRTIPSRALAQFCAHVADLLQAGVPLLEALQDLSAVMPAGTIKYGIDNMIRSLQYGTGLSASCAQQPELFSPVSVAILAAGEASGKPGQAFAQLADYIGNIAKMNERIRKATRYPIFLACVACGVIIFMLVMVVPQIIAFLNSINGELPPSTRLLVSVSQIFAEYWWKIGMGGITVFLAVAVLRRTVPQVACAIDAALLRLPIVGSVLRKMLLARFAQCFAILIRSGLTIPECLKGARDVPGNFAMMAQLERASHKIISGSPLSVAMGELFPPFALRLMCIGEQSGNIAKAFNDIAAYYDRESTESAERMIAMLEPVLTLLIGAVLAWVVLAILGPIYGSISHMNGGM